MSLRQLSRTRPGRHAAA